MAGGAALFKGGMAILPDQALALTAMGVVTAKTFSGLGREVLMANQRIRLIMTAQTKRVAVVLKELVIVGIMRLVTGHTGALGKGLMLYRIFLFGQGLVAAKTAFRNGPAQQALVVRGMGAVTGQALPLPYGLMLYPLAKGFFSLIVAGIAEISALFLEQPLKFGHMGIMAFGALALGHRLMNNFPAKLLLGMTADTALDSPGRSRGNRDQQARRKQYSNTNLHHFPSP